MANPFEIIGQELPKFLKEMNVPFTGGDGYRSVMDPPDSGEVERKTNEALLTAGASAVPVAKGLNALFKVPGMTSVGLPVGLTAATGDPTNMLPGLGSLLGGAGDAEAKLTKANLSSGELDQLLDILKKGGSLPEIFKQMKLARVTPIQPNAPHLGWDRFTSEMPDQAGLDKLESLLANSRNWRTDIPNKAQDFIKGLNPRDNLHVVASHDMPDLGDIPKDNVKGYLYNAKAPGGPRQIYLNSGYNQDLKGYLQTMFHERQHDWDGINNRSDGFNPKMMSDNMLKKLNEIHQKNYPKGGELTKFNAYDHNIGEVRARLNSILETDPDAYQGLETPFHYFNKKAFPNSIWRPSGKE